MRRQYIIFLSLLGILLLYTNYKFLIYTGDSFLKSFLITFPFFVFMFSTLFITRSYPRLAEKTWYQFYSGLSTLFIGIWGSFILLALIFDVLYVITFCLFNLTVENSAYYVTLLHLRESINFYLFPISCAFGFMGFLEVLRGPVVKTITMHHPAVTPDLDSLKIVQISDLHIGLTVRKSYVKKVVQRVNHLNPDIIVMTGDIVDADMPSVEDIVYHLSDLKSIYGVFYVPGNHEYYWQIESILPEIQKTGAQLLLNANKVITINQSHLLIAGITDPAARFIYPLHIPNVSQAAASTVPAHFKILLAHQPGIYTEAEKQGFNLQLSGHTHAGQFFPFNLVVKMVHKFSSGLSQFKSLFVYVNSGTGYWGPANRFGIPAEITLIQLKSES